MSELQLFDPLSSDVEAALRASIKRFGVLVPVVKDQHGRIVDGHHRSRIADQLGVKYRVDEITVASDDEARDIARTLNADRRQLTPEQRKAVVAVLAAETVAVGREEVAKHSERAIAGALGVSQDTVQRDMGELTDAGQLSRPAKTLGRDRKVRATEKPKPATQKAPTKRRPLPAAAKDTGWALRREVEKIERIFADDRFADNKDQVATHLRGHLTYAVETLSGLLDHLNHQEENINAT